MRTLLKYTAQAARRREPTVGQEAVSTRSRKRRSVRSQWSPPRQGRLKTACCLSARGVATAKQRFDRAVGTTGAPFSKYKNSSLFQRNKIAPKPPGASPFFTLRFEIGNNLNNLRSGWGSCEVLEFASWTVWQWDCLPVWQLDSWTVGQFGSFYSWRREGDSNPRYGS